MSLTTTRIKLSPSYWRHEYGVPFSEDIVPSSLFLRHRHFLVFDIETQRTFQEAGGADCFDRLGVSVACAYDSKTDQMFDFRENELKKLFDLMEQRLCIGYNIRGFDLPVLACYGLEVAPLDVFDLMYDLETLTRRRFLKLETVAKGTLGTGKSADGLMAIEWWKQGEIQKIIDYCRQDVEVTRKIFQFGRQNGYVRFRMADETNKDIPVQWN